MTVLAWDGKTLAADRQATSGGFANAVTKIHRVPGGIVGFTGNEGHAVALLAWFKDGRDPTKWPKKEGTNCASAVYITDEGLFCYSGEDGPHAAQHHDRFDAWGAGYAYALAAMYLGCDARRAVEVACQLDINCGKGIDTLTVKEPAIERVLKAGVVPCTMENPMGSGYA